MRALIGFVVFAMALSFAVVEFYLPPQDRDDVLSTVARLGAPPSVDKVPTPVRATRRTFSPASPLFSLMIEDRAPTVAETTPAEVAEAPSAPVLGWSTVVTMAPSAGAVNPGQHLGLSPADGNARYELVVDLQRELKRLGCYYGPLNGVWGARAKNAMSDFGTRVNAGLSVEKPDYALLNLLRGHGAQVCNAECSPGEVVTRDGRCLASTVLARTEASNARVAIAAPVHEARRAVEGLPGRMSVGGPALPRDASSEGAASGAASPGLDGLAAANPDADDATLGPAVDGSGPYARPAQNERYEPRGRPQRSARSRPSRSETALSRLPPNRRYVPPPRSLVTLR